jgi:hypothetical protein
MSAELNSASFPLYPNNGTEEPSSWAGVVPASQQAYDIRAARISEGRRAAAFSRANAILCDGTSKIEFFVQEMTLNVGISGTTSQARYTRDFYAHNIVLPSLTVKAQCLDQGDYSVLTEFIHQAQKKAVGNAANNITQLEINGGGIKVNRSIMKGEHERTCVQGFVPRIERKYKKGEYAPIFSFEFSIAQSFAGIYKGISASVFENQQTSWVSVLEGLTTPYQPTYVQQETATNSKPISKVSPLPETPPEPNKLVSALPVPGEGGL